MAGNSAPSPVSCEWIWRRKSGVEDGSQVSGIPSEGWPKEIHDRQQVMSMVSDVLTLRYKGGIQVGTNTWKGRSGAPRNLGWRQMFNRLC